jgi:hypothetical protein
MAVSPSARSVFAIAAFLHTGQFIGILLQQKINGAEFVSAETNFIYLKAFVPAIYL